MATYAFLSPNTLALFWISSCLSETDNSFHESIIDFYVQKNKSPKV